MQSMPAARAATVCVPQKVIQLQPWLAVVRLVATMTEGLSYFLQS